MYVNCMLTNKIKKSLKQDVSRIFVNFYCSKTIVTLVPFPSVLSRETSAP